MRIIKFRFWDLRGGEMIPWENINKEHLHDYLSLDEKIVTPMQYTGLKDKNGIEIYEGDIVKWGCDIGEVIFNEDGWKIHIKELRLPQNFYATSVCDFIVIGNIYESKKALEENKANE